VTIRDAAHRTEGELAGRKHDEGTRERTSPWKLGGLRVGQLTKRVGREIQNDDVLGRSAELAYYFFLALFPLLFFVVSIFGLVAHNNPQFRLQLMNYIRTMLPPDASSLLSKTLEQILRASSGTKLILGLLGALWSGSVGVAAVMEMCNITYDVKDQRPFWKSRGLAILLTIACSILMVAALGLILYGPTLADAVFGKNPVVAWTWKIVQWPVAVLFVLATFALIYYFGPDVEHPKWHWITPGSAVGVLLWLAGSFAFRVYLHFFNTYSATYGSLGAVIILLTWLYLTGAAVMIGSEINAEIEHAAAEHGRPEAKAEGEKVPPTKAA
jgi:membrane protein